MTFPHITFDKELSEKKEQNDEVEDLKVKVKAEVTVGKNCDDTVSDDYQELNQLHDCDEWFYTLTNGLNVFVLKGTVEIIIVHDHVNT